MVFENLDEYLSAVEAEMRDSLADAQEDLAPYYGMISYHLGWADRDLAPSDQSTGKRLRPLLCVLACEACGGEWRGALPAAAAIELIHNFSLIHDDIEDNSPVRRHRATVWSLWGQAQAINVGDGLFAISRLALQRLTNSGASPGKVLQAFQVVDRTCLSLTEGQYLDLAFEDAELVTIEMYMEMIGKKTAALMGCATRLGALLGTDDEGLIEKFGQFGHQLGLLFQIVDDVLGVWGSGESTGKGVGEDIVRRKKSLPVVYGLEKSEQLRHLYGQQQWAAEQQQEVMKLLNDVSAPQYSEEMAARQLSMAVDMLQSTRIENEARRKLEVIARFLLQRQH
jgi:geranylgeranyl diphosphate synthase type I